MSITTNKRMTHKAKDYAYFWNEDGEARQNVEGSVQIFDSDGDVIDSFGSGGGAGGGGNNTWSNAQGDFTASVTASTKNITITGLPFTLEAKHVVLGSVKKVDSSGNVTNLDLGNVTVSAGVITLGDIDDDFVATDSVVVTLFGPDKAYDGSLDQQLVNVQNPVYAHYTSPEHLIDEEDQADSTVNRYVVPFEGYSYASFHIKTFADTADDSIDVDLYYTNNEDASDASDTDWISASADVLGGTITTSNTTDENMYIVDTPTPILKWMVKVSYTYGGGSSANNSCDVYVKKSS